MEAGLSSGEIPETSKPASLDPLLIVATTLLYVLLAGIAVAAIAMGVGLATELARNGAPWGAALWDPAWRPISGLLFALGALWLVADSVLAVLGMISAVGRGEAFDPANVGRLERIAWNTIGLAITGLIARLAGVGIQGDINGFEIGVDLPTSIGFAMLIFILARVFRQGAAMQTDLEGTV